MLKLVLVLSAAALAGGAFIGAKPAVRGDDGAKVAFGYLDQKLDHFNPVDQRTWTQKFVSWNGSDAGDGPVFILLQGQEPVVSDWRIFATFARQLGDDLFGRSFQLEHRFYGGEKSRTTPDMSLENLRYLSVDQALADIAYFISYIRKTAMIPEKAKVVLYGGEYAGDLATWARLKYPHLVDAAVASSAPLRAQLDYSEYIVEVMKKLEHYGGKGCGKAIRDVVNYVEKESKTAKGLQGLVKTFKLCPPFGSKKWDVDMLLHRIATNVPIGIVNQINVEPTMNFAKEICKELQKPWSAKGRAEKVAQLGAFGQSDPVNKCENVDYDKSIEVARVEKWGTKDSEDDEIYDRPMLYQMCFELGGFRTLSSWKGRAPLDLSLQKCKDVFGAAFDQKALEKAVARTNEEFGGDAPNVERVVFVRGGADPNNVLGVRDDLEDMEPVITIPDRVACTDMHRETGMDSEDLKEAHNAIKERITKYLDMTN